MSFIPVPDCVEVRIDWEIGSRTFHTVFNVTSLVAWTVGAMDALGAAIIDAIVADGFSWLPTAISAVNLHITDLSSASAPAVDVVHGSGTNTLPVAGTDTHNVVANNAALVTTLRTGNRGRSFRGRNYWPGLTIESLASDGESIVGTRVARQQAFVANLIAAIAAGGSQAMAVVSRHTGGHPRTTGIATDVQTIDTNDHIDTQRRRVRA